jgi:hypothetical protein
MAEKRIAPVILSFRHKGQLTDWQWSSKQEVINGVKVPMWITQRRHGVGGPDMFIKVAMRDGSPEVVELSFISQPGQSEVRQKHLRAVDIDRLAANLYASSVAVFGPDPSHDDEAQAMRAAEKFIELQRLPRDYRVINDSFLQNVAQVYRENIGHAPTKAVAKQFEVKDRMASTYVDKARKKGYLPPTTQGRKKA